MTRPASPPAGELELVNRILTQHSYSHERACSCGQPLAGALGGTPYVAHIALLAISADRAEEDVPDLSARVEALEKTAELDRAFWERRHERVLGELEKVKETARQFASVTATPTILAEVPRGGEQCDLTLVSLPDPEPKLEKPVMSSQVSDAITSKVKWKPLQRITREQAEGLPEGSRMLRAVRPNESAVFTRGEGTSWWNNSGMEWQTLPDGWGTEFLLIWHPSWGQS